MQATPASSNAPAIRGLFDVVGLAEPDRIQVADPACRRVMRRGTSADGPPIR